MLSIMLAVVVQAGPGVLLQGIACEAKGSDDELLHLAHAVIPLEPGHIGTVNTSGGVRLVLGLLLHAQVVG